MFKEPVTLSAIFKGIVPEAVPCVNMFVKSTGFPACIADCIALLDAAVELVNAVFILSLVSALPATSLDATDCKVSPANIWSVVSFDPASVAKDTVACLAASAAATPASAPVTPA